MPEDRAEMDRRLARFADQCEEVRQWASTALHVVQVQGRSREFASALLRNAKGVQAAANAWRQELKNA